MIVELELDLDLEQAAEFVDDKTFDEMKEVELTEDDQPEQNACDDMFPDGWIDELEKEEELEKKAEEEKFKEDVDLLEQFIRIEEVCAKVAASNQVQIEPSDPEPMETEPDDVDDMINFKELVEVELTEDDQPEQTACEDMFPDGWIEELEKEEEDLEEKEEQEAVDLYQELIINDDIFTGVAPPNQVYTEDDAPDRVQLEMAMVETRVRYFVYVKKRPLAAAAP